MTTQPNTKCTCPSGDGSLRWPCPKHPPAAAQEAVAYWRVTFRMYPENSDCCETFVRGPDRPTLDTLGISPRPVQITSMEPYFAAPVTAAPAEMSPEFTDTARAAIAWVLWHHQGASSPVGQPLRFALGMGQYEPLADWRIAEAKRYAEWAGATTAKFHEARPTPPAAPGIDLTPLWRLSDAWLKEPEGERQSPGENRLRWAMAKELRDALTLLDASPKGGSDLIACVDRIEEAIEHRVPHDIYGTVHVELSEIRRLAQAGDAEVQP